MDANKAGIAALKTEIDVLCELLISYRRNRKMTPSALVGEVVYLFDWMHICTRHLRERTGMPTKKNDRGEWHGFVECKLTDAEKELFGQWDIHDGDLFVLLSAATCTGLKLSLTFNKQNEHFVASFTGGAESGKNEGWTLSAFAPDWYNAVRALLFKHEVLLADGWDAAKDRPSEGIG